MVDKTKKSEGCIGISEKCVFTLKSLICRVATGSNLSGFIRAIVVLQVIFSNLISFQKNAIRRAVGESRAEDNSLVPWSEIEIDPGLVWSRASMTIENVREETGRIETLGTRLPG